MFTFCAMPLIALSSSGLKKLPAPPLPSFVKDSVGSVAIALMIAVDEAKVVLGDKAWPDETIAKEIQLHILPNELHKYEPQICTDFKSAR
jgi:hypothetical protein